VSRKALLALRDAITRFEHGELDLHELRSHVFGAADREEGTTAVELRSLGHALEAIELNVCEAERRGAALEQLEPVARLLRVRVAAA
jgi:hypothetical protein